MKKAHLVPMENKRFYLGLMRNGRNRAYFYKPTYCGSNLLKNTFCTPHSFGLLDDFLRTVTGCKSLPILMQAEIMIS